MTTINNQDVFVNNLQNLIAENRFVQAKNGEDPKAMLASLTMALEEIVDQLDTGSASKSGAPKPVSNPPTPTAAQGGPSDSSMQQLLGELMGLLATLESQIAQWGNQRAQADSSVNKALVTDADAQMNTVNKDLATQAADKTAQQTESNVMKYVGIGVGVLIAAVAILCGQPELAAIVIVMTVLSASGAMDKATQALSTELQKAGMSENDANILASAIIIAATIVVTIVVGGASAACVAEDISEDTANAATDMTDETTNSTDQTTENTANKANNATKTSKNPFTRFPKSVNLGVLAGSQAVMSTNFGQYLAAIILSGMPDGTTKEMLTGLIEVIVDLLAALAGGGASAAECSGGTIGLFSKFANVLKVMQYAKIGAYAVQAGGQITEAITDIKLALDTFSLGQGQSLLTLLQALISMNSGAITADTKALTSMLRAHSQELASMTVSLNEAPAAVAKVLQG